MARFGLAGLLAGVALLGLAVSAYLTAVHYQQIPLACSTGGPVDCGAVTHSSYSVLPGTGIPITLPGMGWFVVCGALALVLVRRPSQRRMRVAVVLVAWSVIGMAAVLYLVYAELVVIHRVCEWCTAVHLLVFVSLLLSIGEVQLVAQAEYPHGQDEKDDRLAV